MQVSKADFDGWRMTFIEHINAKLKDLKVYSQKEGVNPAHLAKIREEIENCKGFITAVDGYIETLNNNQIATITTNNILKMQLNALSKTMDETFKALGTQDRDWSDIFTTLRAFKGK